MLPEITNTFTHTDWEDDQGGKGLVWPAATCGLVQSFTWHQIVLHVCTKNMYLMESSTSIVLKL